MRRLPLILGAMVIALLLSVPAVLAADPAMAHDGRVLVSTGGDVTLPAGEHADAVVVVNGHATIGGDVNTVLVIDGSAEFSGAKFSVFLGSDINCGRSRADPAGAFDDRPARGLCSVRTDRERVVPDQTA